MDTSMIHLILWIPFLVAVVITGLIFMIGGYRKGLRRALVSLGATVVGAVLSILLAKVIAPLVTPAVSKAIPVESLFGDDVPVNLVSMFLDSIIQVVVTQVLFFLLLIFVTTICRILMGYFFGKKKVSAENDEVVVPEKASKKWGGFGIGFVNAMLFSLLLMLPLYGTIAAYVPAITKMYSMSAAASGNISNPNGMGVNPGMQGGATQTDDELMALLEGISNHPAIQITGKGPVADIYDSLSETKVNDATVNYSEMAETMTLVMTEVEALKAIENEEELVEHSKELLTVLRENVIEEDWAYELVKEVKGSLQDYVPAMDDESYEVISKVLDTVCSSKESFEEIGTKVLDSVIKALETGDMSEEEQEDMMEMFADILKDAGVN